ncbi:hypothetical protein V1505DRAFT_359198 [Lipomyces doorenjongii]
MDRMIMRRKRLDYPVLNGIDEEAPPEEIDSAALKSILILFLILISSLGLRFNSGAFTGCFMLKPH